MKWYEVVERIQARAERVGFVCAEFVTWLVFATIAFVRRLFSKDDSDQGEGYLRGFPKR